MTQKLYIVNSSDEPNNVIFGHASFAKSAGFEPIFVFPYRHREQDFDEFYKSYRTIRLNFTFSNKSAFAYFWSNVLLWLYTTLTFFFRRDAKYFLAIDLVGTVACMFIKLRGASVNTFVSDNFSARYAMSTKAYGILRAIESSVFKLVCDSCIFPDRSRYLLLGSPNIRRFYSLPNILSDYLVPTYQGSSSEKLIVMFCGWLVASRGLELVEDILNNTESNVEFLLVGSGDEKIISMLASNKRINYIGRVSREENLRLMAKVDINVAFYNPRILINRFALPQKIYDSLMIGCPLFVNSEVQMSASLMNTGACFTEEYFSTIDISRKLQQLAKDKKPLYEMSKAMAIYRTHHCNFKQVQLAGKEVYREILSN